MSNKTQLQSNNLTLNTLFTKVNEITAVAESLPDKEVVSEGELNINGIVKEYQVLAGENINAGDFVEFTKKVSATKLNSVSNSCYTAPCCVQLDKSRVFIAHSYNSSKYYLYATLVQINGATITATSTQLSSTAGSCYRTPSCVRLDENRVFIAHTSTSSASAALDGTIVTLNGTSMKAVKSSISTESGSCYHEPDCVLVDENKVFIGHSSESAGVAGTLIQINDTAIEILTTKTFDSTIQANDTGLSCVLVENNKIFMAYGYSTFRFLYGTLVTINGTTMTYRTTSLTHNDPNSCYSRPSCALLNDNKVFIAHCYNNNSQYLYGTIVQISGTSMTATSHKLNTNTQSCLGGPACASTGKDKLVVVHHYSESRILTKTEVSIDGTTLSATTTTLDTTATSSWLGGASCIKLEDESLFIAHPYSSSKYLYSTVEYPVVRSYSSTIDGVAKTSGSSGEPIEVYTLN